MRDYRLYLADIVKSSEKVQRYTSGMSFDDFVADERTFDAVLRNLEIIGEATLSIPKEVYERYPQVEWRRIGGLRNLLAHGYFNVKESVIWDIVQNKVPPLQEQVKQILELERASESIAITDNPETSVELLRFAEQSESTGFIVRTIYPAQRERAAVIVPIAYSLLEAGRKPSAKLLTRKFDLVVEEIETKDYKLTLDNEARILLIAAKDTRNILIKLKIEEQMKVIEFAEKLTPKDVKKWLEIQHDLLPWQEQG